MNNLRLIHLIAVFAVIVGMMLLSGCNGQTEPVPTTPTQPVPAETQQVTVAEEESQSQVQNPGLPKLYLAGDISGMQDKSDERVIAFTYEDGAQTESGYVKIKVQGSSSLAYEKKNYTIKMYRDPECDDKLKVDMGWGEENKYCLKANWIDKTHARNIVTARIASQIQEKYNVLPDTPNHGLIDGFPVEVYNNNEFLGLYTWNIPKDEWLLNMDGDNPDHIAVCGSKWDEATLFWDYPNFTSWELEVGEENDENLAKLNRLFDFVMNSSNEEFVEHFHEYLDLDAALNYYLMMDLAHLNDNWAKNMLLFTYDSEIWYLGLYDLDTSWGTYYTGLQLYDYAHEQPHINLNCLFLRMESFFSDQLIQRYFELRKDIFTKEHILNEFHSFRNGIPDDVFAREVTRWGNEIPGYDYGQIEEYLDCRFPILDAKYSDWDAWLDYRYQATLEYLDTQELDEETRESRLELLMPPDVN